MARIKFQVYVSYSQLCIFQKCLSSPFNDWSERSYEQGFSWRNGSVSFRTLEQEGHHEINLLINDEIPSLSHNVARAFIVPFEINDYDIEVASISESVAVAIPSGLYALQVELLQKSNKHLHEVNVRFNLKNTDFIILKTDLSVKSRKDLDVGSI